MQSLTTTDPAAHRATLTDDVLRLRAWGTSTVRVLPQPPIDECTIGSDETCTLQLDDPSHRVSRLHACLVRHHHQWLLRDVGSKNGVRIDGARRDEIMLEPGLEIGIGGIILIAESERSIALRGFLARLLGTGREHAAVVDHALRLVRLAAARRLALILCGTGDLVPLARSLHRRTRPDRPFLVCDPHRRRRRADVRSAENYPVGMDALAAATPAGGSLCFRAGRLPADFRDVVAAARAPSSQVQLIVCTAAETECTRYGLMPIAIPPLAERTAELDQIIREYAQDAMAELALPRSEFPAADLAWVHDHDSNSLPEIEKATLRLVALRASRTRSEAAGRLDMAPVSLLRWIGRRHLPEGIVP